MKDRRESELEAMVHEELRKLPEVTAPVSLVPRVLAALGKCPRPSWWQQAWWEWPQAVRWATAVLAMATLIAWCGWPMLTSAWLGGWVGQAGALIEPGRQAWQELLPVGMALAALARWVSAGPWLALVAFFAATLYVLCIGVGSVFLRYFYRPARAS